MMAGRIGTVRIALKNELNHIGAESPGVFPQKGVGVRGCGGAGHTTPGPPPSPPPRRPTAWFVPGACLPTRCLVSPACVCPTRAGTPKWEHITTQIGMFAFTGLSPEQIDALREDHTV